MVRARALWALGEPDVAEQELRGVISTAMALGSTPARLAAAHQQALLLRERGQFTLAQEALARALRGVEADGGAPVLARVQEMRGGQTYDADFATRMKGHGVWADLVHQRFGKTCARLGFGAQRVELDMSLFRPAGAAGQGRLF